MQWPDSSHRNIATSLEGFRVLTRFLRSFSTAQQENFANSVFCCYSHNSKTPTLISPQPLNRIEPFNLLHSSIWLEEDSGERSNKGDWILTELQEDKNRSSFPYCQNSVRPHYFGGISMNTCPIINFIWSKPSSRLDGSLEKRISANGQGKQKLLRSTWFFRSSTTTPKITVHNGVHIFANISPILDLRLRISLLVNFEEIILQVRRNPPGKSKVIVVAISSKFRHQFSVYQFGQVTPTSISVRRSRKGYR